MLLLSLVDGRVLLLDSRCCFMFAPKISLPVTKWSVYSKWSVLLESRLVFVVLDYVLCMDELEEFSSW